jgi:3-deoxy-D-manno-octulosonic-acid transferase
MIDAHRRLREKFPALLTMLAPRHPERGAGLVDIATAAGLRVGLRSRGELPSADINVYVVDTLGELGLIYRLAPIVFMGGSLASHGGQNPIEAVKLGAAVLHGPHVWNFADIYAALDQSGGAASVADAAALITRLGAWLADPVARKTVADAAATTAVTLCGALDRTLGALAPYLMQPRAAGG